MRAARLTNASAQLRCKGESPLLNSSLLNSVLAELAAQGTWARAHGSGRGLYLAVETLSGWFLADSETDLRWLGSLGCPVRLAPSGQRALEAVTDWVRS